MAAINENGIFIDLTGLTEVGKEFDKFVPAVIKRFARKLSTELSKGAPTGATGKFRQGIGLPQQEGPLTWAIGMPFPLWKFIEGGTKAHWIRPKNKKALAFLWPGKGLGGHAMPYLRSIGFTPHLKMGGMRTHQLTARKGAFAGRTFKWQAYKRGDESVYKSVFHPGTSPNPFAARAIDKIKGRLSDIMTEALLKVKARH